MLDAPSTKIAHSHVDSTARIRSCLESAGECPVFARDARLAEATVRPIISLSDNGFGTFELLEQSCVHTTYIAPPIERNNDVEHSMNGAK